jgi:hypothetical protein
MINPNLVEEGDTLWLKRFIGTKEYEVLKVKLLERYTDVFVTVRTATDQCVCTNVYWLYDNLPDALNHKLITHERRLTCY